MENEGHLLTERAGPKLAVCIGEVCNLTESEWKIRTGEVAGLQVASWEMPTQGCHWNSCGGVWAEDNLKYSSGTVNRFFRHGLS